MCHVITNCVFFCIGCEAMELFCLHLLEHPKHSSDISDQLLNSWNPTTCRPVLNEVMWWEYHNLTLLLFSNWLNGLYRIEKPCFSVSSGTGNLEGLNYRQCWFSLPCTITRLPLYYIQHSDLLQRCTNSCRQSLQNWSWNIGSVMITAWLKSQINIGYIYSQVNDRIQWNKNKNHY